MAQLPYGIIFDMDGVLVDSEPFIVRAVTQMFAEYGLKIQPQDFHPFTGTGEKYCISGIAEKYKLPIDIERSKDRIYDIYLEIIKGNLKPSAGTIEFIAKCRKMNKKLAVASSAEMRKIAGNLAEIRIPPETFDAVIAGDDVEHKKPAPDIFLLAAERIGLPACDCLVIEDALNGIKAAKAAGAKCLAITSSYTAEKLPGADFYAPDLAHVPTEAINWQTPKIL